MSSSVSTSGTIHLTTLEDISKGVFPSATYQRGQKDIFGNTIQTKTLGLNGTMVEVENLKVQVVGGPAYDMDYHIELTDGVISDFITEVPKFPQASTASYLVAPIPAVGDTIDIVGTAFRDGAHWEVHPMFAWQPTSQGPINYVCAPAGTVSSAEQSCFSLSSSTSSTSTQSSNSVETTVTTTTLASTTTTATTEASLTSPLNESISSSAQSNYSSTSSSLLLNGSSSTTTFLLSLHSTMMSVEVNAMSESDNSSMSFTSSIATFPSLSPRLIEISGGIVCALISVGLLGLHLLRRKR